MSVERRTLRGMAVSALAVAAGLGQSLLLVPLVLAGWGEGRYGAWLGLNAIVASTIVLDTSHQNFLGGEIQKAWAVDRGRVRQLLASGLGVALVLGLLETLGACVLAATGGVESLLGVSASSQQNEPLGLALVALVGLWTLPGSTGGILVRLYPPAGRFVTSQWWGLAFRFAQFLAVVGAARLGFGLLAASVATGLVTIGLSVPLLINLKKHFGEFWPFWRGGSLRLGAQNVARAGVLMLTSLVLQLQTSWLIILVTHALGATATALFGTMRTLSNSFIQGVQVVNSPVAPELVRYHATRDSEKVSAVLDTSWLVLGACVNWGLLLSLPFVAFIYEKWTRGRLEFHLPLYLGLAWSVCIKATGAPLNTYLVGINHLRAQSVVAAAQSAIVFLLAWLFMPSLQLTGLGFALAAGELLGSIVLGSYFVARLMHEEFGARFSLASFGLACAGTAIVGTVFLAYGLGYATLKTLIPVAAVSLAAVQITQWLRLPVDVKLRLKRLAGPLVRSA